MLPKNAIECFKNQVCLRKCVVLKLHMKADVEGAIKK